MRPLRVLTIGHSYTIELNRAVMAQVALDPGIELTVAAPKFIQGDLRPTPLEPSESPPYTLVGLPAYFTRKVHLLTYGGLGKLIRPGAFDVVHAWQEPYIVSGYQIARAATRAGSHFVFRTAQSIPKRYPPPFAQFERYCVNACSGWIAGGHLVQQALLDRGYPRTNAEVITLGVDTDVFRPDPAASAEVRRRLGLEGPIVGYMGRLHESKGLDVLMTALEGVKAPWNLLALGSGPYEARINEWAARRGYADRVRVMLARHGEVPAYLAAMDILTLPSQTMPNWKEQFGRVVVEGYACGVPVIGSDSGEIPFLLSDGAGVVVGEKDVAGWTESLERLLGSPELRRQYGEAGRERCLRDYSANRVARRWVEYYRKVAEGEPAAGPSRRFRPIHAG